MKKDIIATILVLTSIIIFIYGNICRTFYQQDEWISLGHILTQGFGAFISSSSIMDLIGGQGRILAVPIHFSFFYFFPFNILPFAFFSLSFHIINTILVYFLARKISKSSFVAIITAIFFAFAVSADQAITWVAGTSTMTMPLAFFTIISIFYFLEFIDKKRKKYFWISVITSIIAYYFKESALFLFVFFPTLYVISTKGKFFKKIKAIGFIYWPVFLFLFFILIVRLGGLSSGNNYGYFVTNNPSTAKTQLFFHMIMYPLTSFSQLFFHQGYMFTFASYFERIYYPSLALSIPNPMISEYVVTDMLSIFLTAIILLISFLIYALDKKSRNTLVFAIVFTLFSFLPYIILNKANSYLEPRYYYVSLLGGGLLLGIFINSAKKLFSKYFKSYSYIFMPVAVIVLLIYFNSQIQWVQRGIKNQVDIAVERKHFLNTIKKDYPKLPNKVIFYMTGNQDFNGPGYNVPFQLGPGYTLMVWYYNTGSIPPQFLKEDYLADMMAQGYREIDGKGFGFYRDINLLKKDAISKKLPVNNLIGYYYDAKNQKLIDISGKIKSEVSAKTLVKK